MVVKWTDELSVGVEEIDRQHKELLKRINDLLYALCHGKERGDISNLVKLLEDEVAAHFRSEEAIMAGHNYPGLQVHQAEHIRLIREFDEMKGELESAGTSLSLVLQVQNNAVEWFTKHISTLDKGIGEFLNDK